MPILHDVKPPALSWTVYAEEFKQVLAQFKAHIQQHFPELLESKFLLACSGGIDSVVLVLLCHELNLDFSIAHCNFGLRGKESEEDAEWVKQLGTKIQRYTYIKRFETDDYAFKNKVSIQVAARELRYAWFEELRQIHQLKYCITAHHADDNLETFLINLSRGTGLRGLMGIPEKTETLARPLLKFSREQIEQYAAQQHLEWREDRSNLDKKYLRNQIRHEVVPSLKKTHPEFMRNFEASQGYLRDSHAILEEHFNAVRTSCFTQVDGATRIDLEKLEKYAPIKGYLHGLLGKYGFREWGDVEGLLSASPGKQVYSATHRLVKGRGYLVLEERKEVDHETYRYTLDTNQINEPVSLRLEEVEVMGEPSESILYADKETLKESISIRKWKKGDYFYPFGMKGKRKLLSKFFKDEKMDLIAKENQWLLCSNGAVVWVIGRRGDHRFRVTSTTRNILKISLL